jgi:ribosomal protein S18 acetylase RimI-like enzyme
MVLEIRMLGPGDEAALAHVADDVFDNAVNPALAREFLADPRHHIAVAAEDGLVVGFASGVHYVHPDKPAELWVNEVAVAPSHQRRGLGHASMAALLAHGRSLGCVTAWVLTDRDNEAAMALYTGLGGAEGDEGLGESLRGFVFKLGAP